ncbi:hypothetical protein [Nocardiopsis sp. LDBS1602]|uniref:hypothetical protein n=1 Tax=Nocardiopsis sp. LDBS1602 TaxID=3109597 RepID=UPI002DBC35B4|nr:hypothetical protein [Nocardiopsis sp. LDBS1602]MEC3894337.1 hypothetical protein [Nocardiopsis sp. LDBS1602]
MMNITLRSLGVAALVASLPLATASGVLANPVPTTDELGSLGTAASNDEVSEGLTAEAHQTERSESGSLVSVTWSVENNGAEKVFFNWPAGTSYMYSLTTYYSGVTATSTEKDMRYHPIMDGESDCLCSGKLSNDFKEIINPGEQVAYWSMFSVPSDVDTITLEIPGFDPIEDIPIS